MTFHSKPMFDGPWLRELRAADQVIASQEDAQQAVLLAQTGMSVEAVRAIDWNEERRVQ
jgi:hypothetical protein